MKTDKINMTVIEAKSIKKIIGNLKCIKFLGLQIPKNKQYF